MTAMTAPRALLSARVGVEVVLVASSVPESTEVAREDVTINVDRGSLVRFLFPWLISPMAAIVKEPRIVFETCLEMHGQ